MRVFISYSRKDIQFAERLEDDLSLRDIEVWRDKTNIQPGSSWSDEIQNALDTSDTMLLIVTPDSMASQYVSDEWHYFLDNHKPLIPIILKPANLTWRLNRREYIDFNNQNYEQAF